MKTRNFDYILLSLLLNVSHRYCAFTFANFLNQQLTLDIFTNSILAFQSTLDHGTNLSFFFFYFCIRHGHQCLIHALPYFDIPYQLF